MESTPNRSRIFCCSALVDQSLEEAGLKRSFTPIRIGQSASNRKRMSEGSSENHKPTKKFQSAPKQSKLLLNLPKHGTMNAVDREKLLEKSKRGIVFPKVLRTHAQRTPAQVVRIDTTNHLVRSLRIKKQQEKLRKYLDKTRKRHSAPIACARNGKARKKDQSSATFKTPARGTLTAEEEEERVFNTRCVSPRLGASRVKTPPPPNVDC